MFLIVWPMHPRPLPRNAPIIAKFCVSNPFSSYIYGYSYPKLNSNIIQIAHTINYNHTSSPTLPLKIFGKLLHHISLVPSSLTFIDIISLLQLTPPHTKYAKIGEFIPPNDGQWSVKGLHYIPEPPGSGLVREVEIKGMYVVLKVRYIPNKLHPLMSHAYCHHTTGSVLLLWV